VDIIADDYRIGEKMREQLQLHARRTTQGSASATCTICRMPVVLEEALTVENRAILCRPCVSAIQAAARDIEKRF
jgi:hypothetical protein